MRERLRAGVEWEYQLRRFSVDFDHAAFRTNGILDVPRFQSTTSGAHFFGTCLCRDSEFNLAYPPQLLQQKTTELRPS